MEDFSLSDTGCNGAIWLEFGYPEQSPTPYCCPGGWDEHGKPIFSRPLVQLRRDDNFKRLKNALSATIPGAKDEDGNDCRRYRPPAGECLRYGVTATLTGRISGVNRKPNELNGFGHMGMFSAKLLIQSVERVEATETHPGKN